MYILCSSLNLTLFLWPITFKIHLPASHHTGIFIIKLITNTFTLFYLTLTKSVPVCVFPCANPFTMQKKKITQFPHCLADGCNKMCMVYSRTIWKRCPSLFWFNCPTNMYRLQFQIKDGLVNSKCFRVHSHNSPRYERHVHAYIYKIFMPAAHFSYNGEKSRRFCVFIFTYNNIQYILR